MTVGTHSASRVDVVTGSHTSTIWVGDGLAGRPRVAPGRAWRRREAVRGVEPADLAPPRRAAIQQAIPGDPILIPDGERNKTLASVSRIYDALIRGGADRGSTLVAVGGGVVGDTAGFAAASFLRGITLVQVPTTLLAQVDSAIGGKVGVNHALGKNLIGAFHQPTLVLADPRRAAHAAAAGVPVRALRGGQVRGDLEPAALRSPGALDQEDLRPRPGGADAGNRGVGADQGRGGVEGRARGRAAAHPQLRPHHRPRAGSRDRLPALPPRRGDRLRHAGRGRHRVRPAARSAPAIARRSSI